jgi:riboflavin kinase/FMN adenylyltransferase
MRIIRGLHNLSKLNGCVVTVGNFDGVHLGHQKVILGALEKAKSLGVPLVVISFLPTPQAFFNKTKPSLSSFKEKHFMLDKLGVDIHLVINFNANFSETDAETFVREVLVTKLNMKHCIIGDDFRFGKNRDGDFSMLQGLSIESGFEVESSQSVLHHGDRISSSIIRALLEDGDFAHAAELLGREFSIEGKVVHGNKKGRTINFPTINIPIKRKISPVKGVFAVNIELKNGLFYGVCNVGKRPTVGGEKTLLEVYIFNFNEEVYGQHAKVIFKSKIRDEKRFDSFMDLKQQIALDVKSAHAYFRL